MSSVGQERGFSPFFFEKRKNVPKKTTSRIMMFFPAGFFFFLHPLLLFSGVSQSDPFFEELSRCVCGNERADQLKIVSINMGGNLYIRRNGERDSTNGSQRRGCVEKKKYPELLQ